MVDKEEFSTRIAHNSPHLEIWKPHGGKVPKELKGLYNSTFHTDKAIREYINSREAEKARPKKRKSTPKVLAKVAERKVAYHAKKALKEDTKK